MNFTHEEFIQLKERVRNKYNNIKYVESKALKSKIVFNSNGFHHLRYDSNRTERSKQAQYGKLSHLDDAVKILKLSTTVQEYRRGLCCIGKKDKSGFRKTSIFEWFGFYAVTSFFQKKRIMVVVRRIGGEDGNYHFWSLMPYWKLSNNTRVIGSKVIEDD